MKNSIFRARLRHAVDEPDGGLVPQSPLDEFYTVQQLASLFGMAKQELKEACEKYDIEPRKNDISEYGFVRYDVRKLHNFLYYESRGGKKVDGYHKGDDPWA